jgi:hypothetical protein
MILLSANQSRGRTRLFVFFYKSSILPNRPIRAACSDNRIGPSRETVMKAPSNTFAALLCFTIAILAIAAAIFFLLKEDYLLFIFLLASGVLCLMAAGLCARTERQAIIGSDIMQDGANARSNQNNLHEADTADSLIPLPKKLPHPTGPQAEWDDPIV